MTTKLYATPILYGEDAERAIKAAMRKPTEKSKRGAEILRKKYAGIIKK